MQGVAKVNLVANLGTVKGVLLQSLVEVGDAGGRCVWEVGACMGVLERLV